MQITVPVRDRARLPLRHNDRTALTIGDAANHDGPKCAIQAIRSAISAPTPLTHTSPTESTGSP